MKIYTRTTDKKSTSLYGGSRISKASLQVETYGTLDELNSALGVAVAQMQNSKVKDQKYKSKVKSELERIQNDLFEIGAVLATPKDTKITKGQRIHKELPKYLKARVDELERRADKAMAMLQSWVKADDIVEVLAILTAPVRS